VDLIMPAEDTDNARLTEPPLSPWHAGDASLAALAAIADQVAAATWQRGLPRWFWGEGVCLLGLTQSSQAFTGTIPERVVDWYDKRLLTGGDDPSETVDHVNEMAPGTGALAVAADPRTGRTAYLAPLRRLALWMHGDGVTRAANGAIEHWPGGVWADTMFMAGVFLARLGVQLRDDNLARGGVEQVLAHAQVLPSLTPHRSSPHKTAGTASFADFAETLRDNRPQHSAGRQSSDHGRRD